MGCSRGILYVAVGKQAYADEAVVSARSVRRVMRDISLTIATDLDVTPDPFDRITQLQRGSDGYRAKIEVIRDAPYERTLYLDTDTYIARDLDDLFHVLDRFDLAAAHAPNRVTDPTVDLPDAFPQFNTGVIAFRRETMRPLASRWLHIYDKLGAASKLAFDQDPFRVAVYESNLRVATLPPEFNCRFPGMAGYYRLPVAIFHSRASQAEFEEAARVMGAEPAEFWHGHVYIDNQVWGPLGSASRILDLRPPKLRQSCEPQSGAVEAHHTSGYVERLEEALKLSDNALDLHREWLESMQRSISWRVTAPLRAAKRTVRNLFASRAH